MCSIDGSFRGNSVLLIVAALYVHRIGFEFGLPIHGDMLCLVAVTERCDNGVVASN